MSRRLAMLVLRLYPRGWRERYEDEVCALLEQAPITFRQAVDLMLACPGAWVRGASSRPGLLIAMRLVAGTVGAVAAHAIASLAVEQTGVVLPGVARVIAGLVIAGIWLRLLLLTQLPPGTSAPPSIITPHEPERRAVHVFLKLTSIESSFRVPAPGRVEGWLLTALALAAVFVEYAARTNEVRDFGIPAYGVWLVGYITVMWVFRAPRETAPEQVI